MKGEYKMYLYGYFDNKPPEKVSLGAIKFLTNQLDDFVKLYESDVLITEQDDRDVLNKLKTIRDLLKAQRYDMLITDPNYIIDFNDDNEEYLPKYYPDIV
jgi:hypothetical protein